MELSDYPDAVVQGVVGLAPSGSPLVFITDRAAVSANLKSKFDKQQKAGKNFGRVKFLGIELATFTVTYVILPDDVENFDNNVIPLLRRKGRNGVSPPFDVFNPQIQRYGIDTVTILSTEIGAYSAKDGQTVTMLLEEWAPKPVEPKKDKSAKATNDPLSIDAGNATSVNAANQ